MYDMITPMSLAQPGALIQLKRLTRARGYILRATKPLYFVQLNIDEQNVSAAIDTAMTNIIILSLRSIQSIIAQDGTIYYQADPRDMVYGI